MLKRLRPCYGPLFLSRAQEKRDHNMGTKTLHSASEMQSCLTKKYVLNVNNLQLLACRAARLLSTFPFDLTTKPGE